MGAMVPGNRPQREREWAAKFLSDAGVSPAKAALLGVRGYFRDSMGVVGKNDRGIYDDALFVVTPATFESYNANTDPSVTRRNVAVLKAGLWWYKRGIHGLSKPVSQQYMALVQAAEVTVVRDGVGDDTGWFGINIHRGSYQSTSSLGCQTIHPDQWEKFYALVTAELRRLGQTTIPYLLIEQQG